jgi:hypothetical protein
MDPVTTEAVEVKEAVEKVVEDVHENAPLVPTEAVEEVKAPAAAVEEEPKKTETAEKTETEATEKKTEDLPPVENGNGEAEVVSAEEPAPEVTAVVEESLKRKVDDEVKEDEEKIPEKKSKTVDVDASEEVVEKTAEKPVAEPETVPEQEATA